MAFAGVQHDYAAGANEKDLDDPHTSSKPDNTHHEFAGLDGSPTNESRAFGPPPLVKAMSPERRIEAELALRKKIDLRLLPMVILMYIMNYLDRNNIAAARLAGLEDDLNLTSVQYSVSRAPFQVPYS
jgi:hypothetical protein